MKHKAYRCISPILYGREMTSRNLHTAEVTGSIPVSLTPEPLWLLGFLAQLPSLVFVSGASRPHCVHTGASE